jgi:hypothetical protein
MSELDYGPTQEGTSGVSQTMNDKPIKLILNLAKFKLTIVSDARASQAF